MLTSGSEIDTPSNYPARPRQLERHPGRGAYEAFPCHATGCAWKLAAPFIDGAEEERKLLASGKLRAEVARFPFVGVDTGKPANLGMGSIAWNPYRKRWIMLAGLAAGAVADGHANSGRMFPDIGKAVFTPLGSSVLSLAFAMPSGGWRQVYRVR